MTAARLRPAAAALAALLLTAAATHAQGPARVAIHVDENDPATMNMALNNAANIFKHYSEVGREVHVEIVTYGPGLHMYRADTSPVRDKISLMALEHQTLAFSACLNTVEAMVQKESRDIDLLEEVTVVPSGAVRLMELQEQGWSYLRP